MLKPRTLVSLDQIYACSKTAKDVGTWVKSHDIFVSRWSLRRPSDHITGSDRRRFPGGALAWCI